MGNSEHEKQAINLNEGEAALNMSAQERKYFAPILAGSRESGARLTPSLNEIADEEDVQRRSRKLFQRMSWLTPDDDKAEEDAG